jgi:hydrogenase maturation protease
MSKHTKPTLILGVGNYLLGDEGLGIHAVQELQKVHLPDDVEVLDGGTTGFELSGYLPGRKKIIIIDAVVKKDTPPGTILRISPDDLIWQKQVPISSHESNLKEVIDFAAQLQPAPEIIMFGVVPEGIDNFSTDLSISVKNRLPELIAIVVEEAG